jgi:hypothetical protein
MKICNTFAIAHILEGSFIANALRSSKRPTKYPRTNFARPDIKV